MNFFGAITRYVMIVSPVAGYMRVA